MVEASIAILFEALGPKYFVIISIHIKESHDIKIPPSNAIHSFRKRVLFASRFMQITLTTNNDTTVEGMHLKRIAVS